MFPKVEACAIKQKEKALKRRLLNELAGLHLASVTECVCSMVGRTVRN